LLLWFVRKSILVTALTDFEVRDVSDIGRGLDLGASCVLFQCPATDLRIITLSDEDPDSRLAFEFKDICTVVAKPGSRLLGIVSRAPDTPDTTIQHCILDQVIPRLLAHDGAFVLHAGAVRIGDAAVLFVGESGLGKSTLTASFARADIPILSDDAVVVTNRDGKIYARAVYPGLRLLPDSLLALFPADHPTTDMAHYSDKRRVMVDAAVTDADLPVAAVFLLGDDGLPPDQPEVRPMNAAAACMALVDQTFAADPLRGAVERMRFASQIVRNIPVLKLHYKRDYDALPKVRETLIATLNDLKIKRELP
jgi:hypothetical protein